MDPLWLYPMASPCSSERAGVASHCVRAGHPNASHGPRTIDDVVEKAICTSVIDLHINS